ncbi:methyltransferase domain-containing protein [Propioniciclava flava]|uniref:Ubiquinone biosynthesis methyltransferase UbiE n=1 Tax=Propioniciclava flava TaxID=2072026 RepID=A0A4Q2EEW6_9ACTN|nr:methyltransferase domain-containing protein [Propioniciclava flava]RXW31126.1 ubiquinone biosynthesis methyltransferase UbiE [Propioniciclava flava]
MRRPADQPDGAEREASPADGSTLSDEFDRAASRYDLLTMLNPGYGAALHRAARALVDAALAGPRPGAPMLLDVGCGSGLSTRALLAEAGDGVEVIGVDASAGMLAQARAKPWPPRVAFVQARAEELGRAAADGGWPPAAGLMASYLLRNIPKPDRDAAVAQLVARVRPGGWVVLQDYHVRHSARAKAVWTAVCWAVVVPLATVLRANPAIYRYLWRSVLANDSPAELIARLERAGLTDIRRHPGTGWQRGILHTVLARRPEGTP